MSATSLNAALMPAPAPGPEAAAPVPAPETVSAPDPLDERWRQMQWLPCRLEVQLSVPGLTVGDIMRLRAGVVLETRWQQNADVPIRANGELIAWAEFEGIDEKLAVRVTRLA
jgi:flagellar motor switch protein FliN/FliY